MAEETNTNAPTLEQRIEQLEHEIARLRGGASVTALDISELQAREARRDRMRAWALNFIAGVCYGIIVTILFE